MARSRREVERQIRDLQRYLDGLPERPIEPCLDWPDDNPMAPVVIQFRVRPHKEKPVYWYAAMRIKGKWWTTGDASPSDVTWDELWDWIERIGGLVERPMKFATNWQSVRYPNPTETPPGTSKLW